MVKMKKFFPDTFINTVDGDGRGLSREKRGAWVEIHTRKTGEPCCAEVYSDDQSEYAEIGLWFDDKTLCDYDGVFNLPKEVTECLRELGYVVNEEFE